jgi:hypothetical protein
MKVLKGLFALLLVGVIAGFILSLVAPNLDLASAEFDDDDSEF